MGFLTIIYYRGRRKLKKENLDLYGEYGVIIRQKYGIVRTGDCRLDSNSNLSISTGYKNLVLNSQASGLTCHRIDYAHCQ